MRLALSSYTYTWAVGFEGSRPVVPMTALDLVRRAAELNVEAVQIADNLALHRLSPTELDRLAGSADDLGVAIEVGTKGIRPEHLREYVRLAERFRSPILRVVLDEGSLRPTLEEAVQILGPQGVVFQDAGVVLAVENHDRFSARQIAELIGRLGPWSGVCLDTVNSFGALDGPEAVVQHLGPLTVNLHVKDFTTRRDWHYMGFIIEGTPAGQGMLDVPWLLRSLGPACCSRLTAVIELWTPPDAHLDDTIIKERRWAEESVEYLRPLIASMNSGAVFESI